MIDLSFQMDLDLWDCFGSKKNFVIAELCMADLHLCSNFGKENFHLITK